MLTVVAMDVIGVGFGRTGTASLKLALEQLDFGPCYHMTEVMDRRDRIRQWRRVAEGQRPDWPEIYRGFRSTLDWPGVAYWRELVAAFPEAKVILTVRDPQRWYESAFNTVFRFPMRRHNHMERLLYAFLGAVNPRASELPRMLDAAVWRRQFEDRHFDRPEDRAFAIEAFERHNAQVQESVPADRLLVYRVDQGWEPLCSFLGVPVPDRPFPRVNETEEFMRDIAIRRRKAIVPVVAGSTAVMAVIAVAVAFMTRAWQ